MSHQIDLPNLSATAEPHDSSHGNKTRRLISKILLLDGWAQYQISEFCLEISWLSRLGRFISRYDSPLRNVNPCCSGLDHTQSSLIVAVVSTENHWRTNWPGWRSYMMIKCYIAISMKIVRGGTTFYFLTRDHWWHLSKIIPSMKDISNHQTCIRWLLGGTSCVWGYCWTAIHFKRIPCLQLRFVASIATFDNFRSGRGPASWQLRLGNFTLRNFLAWVK